jgi:hypothetical protein
VNGWGYSFNGSTPSSELQASYNCVANKEFYDVWFEVVVPRSGYFSVKCKNKIGVKNDLLLEVYSGTCDKKELIGCQMVYGISGVNPIGYLPFVGMKAGEKVFIRVGGKGYGQQGNFDMCVSKSFENICTITKIEVGETSNCNAKSNTHSQDITVSYQSTGALNKLIVNGQYFTLMENPQTITLRDLPTNKPLTIRANLLNLEGPTCWVNSIYLIESIYAYNLLCEDENKKLDDCFDAEPIEVSGDCEGDSYSLSNSVASGYVSDGGCIEQQKDEWFELIVPIGGEILIEVASLKNKYNLLFEVYIGDCDTKKLIACNTSSRQDAKVVTFSNLEPGEILYVRVADMGEDMDAVFSLCVSEPIIVESRSVDVLLAQDEDASPAENKKEVSIQCLPNPTIDYVHVVSESFDEHELHNIFLIDSNGRIIIESNLTSRSHKLDLTSVSSGIYVLIVENGGDRQIRKIVKSSSANF